MTVDAGVNDIPNTLTASITICAPGTTECQTIDHVLVDDSSSGLRIFASQLPASLTLAQEVDNSGNALAECLKFSTGYAWGPVRLVDLQIGGEKASSLPVQVIDPDYASVPSACASAGTSFNTPSTVQANGILGIGFLKRDCGAFCAQQALDSMYYGCVGTSCTPISLAEAYQVANPIPFFATDNNGSMLSLPAVADGASSVTGQLVFGIGTQTNNALGAAQVIGVSSSGTFTTVLNGTAYPQSVLDSGIDALFFDTSAVQVCASPYSSWYCPASTVQLSATIQGENGVTRVVDFYVGNAIEMFGSGNLALPLLAATAIGPSASFIWGLPFFYGRNVFMAVEQQATPAGPGPYIAY